MSIGETQLAKMAIGFLGGPIGGGYYGYQYAKNKEELQILQGQTVSTSPVFHTVVGMFLNSFGGVVYGAQCAEQEKEIKTIIEKQHLTGVAASHAASAHAPSQALEPQLSQTQWQDKITASRAQETAQGATIH